MKEQPVEIRENNIENSIGQRPIHATYEPPGPLPQFRARPRLTEVQSQPQPVAERRPARSATAKLAQNTSIQVPSNSETEASEKKG